MRILVIDDTGAQRFIIKRLLQQECGIAASDIDEAENGEKGLEKTAGSEYGLIIVDWNMPVLDGLEFLKEIRKNRIMTPVVMVTSENEESKKESAVAAGANHFLTKPFTGSALLEILRNYISK
ncbi:MAG TPA: response regulator [Leptospiraceae bacterium]|nr:response regulator [Leptospiraceae bacterium]HMY68136.1 response regulator [Leptospiraceae bacterium]HNF27502.1 response regulator [Leptospiraceae bacterium]HNH06884.1 response regulator [Leptospiraceae bacterium]HNI95175.1 response regulator [Leptospiraceae bacterium]